MGAARSRVDSNVEGERHTAKLNSCEEQAQSQPKRIATDPSQVITAVPNQGHECQSNSCLQNGKFVSLFRDNIGNLCWES